MSDEQRSKIRWDLHEDGGGTAEVFSLVEGDRVVQSSYDFESLDELPSDLAQLIRTDGRRSAQIG